MTSISQTQGPGVRVIHNTILNLPLQRSEHVILQIIQTYGIVLAHVPKGFRNLTKTLHSGQSLDDPQPHN